MPEYPRALSYSRQPPELPKPPERVVSLVPSLTESLFDLGFGPSVVGITDYCPPPASQMPGIVRLGGTKNPRVADIIELRPDMIFANFEENTPDAVQALTAAGLTVWVSFPTSVDESLDLLRKILAIYHSDASAPLINSLQMAIDWARAATIDQPPIRYFCPIWHESTSDRGEWWMTINHQTYTHDVISVFGGENVFSSRERLFPLAADLGLEPPQETADRDTRYPRVTRQEIISAEPDLVLLPSEPFNFTAEYKLEFSRAFPKLPAVKNDRVILLDGSLITWHGTRLAKSVQELPSIIQK